MKRVLILGGGFGGVATAHHLRQKLSPKDEVILIDRRTHFMVGFRKTWALVGESSLEAGQRELATLERQGIQVVHGTITTIDPSARAAEVDGRRIEADAMVVALGASLAVNRIPGFSAYALNVYDPQEIPRAAEALRNFPGGRVVVGVFGTPYKCPPAPYEIAIKVNEFFQTRGVEAALEVFTPLPMSIPILGQSGCGVIEGRLAENGIAFLANHQATAVEAGEIIFTTGRRSYDLLLGVPPHRCPDVVAQSGLTDSGNWVRVNPATLETRYPGVYAIGDVVELPMADGKPLPKAGIFAEAMGQAVADRIAASFTGQESDTTFEGRGGCFLEVGSSQALMVEGWFLARPAPQVTLTGPSLAYLQEKRAFETERLQAWFS
jgi:sulfide:quinone oxidoreductase